MNKNIIRKEINTKLNILEQIDIDTKSDKIFQNLKKSGLLNDKKNIMFYLNIKKEVRTDFMLDRLKSKNIYLPKVIDDYMKAYKFRSFKDLEIGAFGIREPKESEEPNFLEAIIVPLVAVTRTGIRVGKGKGYYDKFLKKYNSLKIGICYDFQVINNIEKENHDINLDYVITDKEIIKVESN